MTSGYDDEDFEIITLSFIDIYISDKDVLEKKFCHNLCQFIFVFYIFISIIEKNLELNIIQSGLTKSSQKNDRSSSDENDCDKDFIFISFFMLFLRAIF